MDDVDKFNEAFKRGRLAGQEDVCREILRSAPSLSWSIAREYLANNQQSSDGEK